MKNFITFITIIIIILILPVKVSAVSSDVIFSSSPLFNETEWKPGSTKSKDFSIKNTDYLKHNVGIKAINQNDSPDFPLSEVLTMQISRGDNILYSGKLKDFYSRGIIDIGDISDGKTQTYTITLKMDDNAGENYQGKIARFDLAVVLEDWDHEPYFRPFPAFPPFPSLRHLFPFNLFPHF